MTGGRASRGRCRSASTGFLTALLFLRSASCRAYRLPPCALINLCHGSRADHTSHRLTAVVKPQPAAAGSLQAQRQLGSLNHSPRSPFIPTQVRQEEQTSPSWLGYERSHMRCSAPLQHHRQGAKAGPQGSRNAPSTGLMQKQARVRLSSSSCGGKTRRGGAEALFLSEQGHVQRGVADSAELGASSQAACSLAQQRELRLTRSRCSSGRPENWERRGLSVALNARCASAAGESCAAAWEAGPQQDCE